MPKKSVPNISISRIPKKLEKKANLIFFNINRILNKQKEFDPNKVIGIFWNLKVNSLIFQTDL
jgi:hypothetical protein